MLLEIALVRVDLGLLLLPGVALLAEFLLQLVELGIQFVDPLALLITILFQQLGVLLAVGEIGLQL